MKYQKPNMICYRIAQLVSWLVATLMFGRKYIRNEIRGKKGAFVVIANHQASLDFVNLIGATLRPMSFVISKSFFSTLPIQGFLKKLGVIPKQQFQTSADDLKKMKRVIDSGNPVVIYPAGLMCEDGLSTPIPGATYKFLKWLGADVYVARTQGTYFVMPKWSKKLRPGRTTMDIYQLFSKEELQNTPLEEIRRRTDEALLYDAYREQEMLRLSYRHNDCVEGLENVLYWCPRCGEEFSMTAAGNTLRCTHCGFTRKSDELGFLHDPAGNDETYRYVSDWSRMIYDRLEEKIRAGMEQSLSSGTKICVIDEKKHKFVEVGRGTVTLTPDRFRLEGSWNETPFCKEISTGNIPALPFSPGKYFEIQDGGQIYRCVLDDGKLVMKFINMVKIFFRLSQTAIREKVETK